MVTMASSLAYIFGLMLMVRGVMGQDSQTCLNNVITGYNSFIEKQTALDQRTATLEASVQKLDNTMKTVQETVVFVAKDTDKTTYNGGDKYVFTNAVVNVGSGYDPLTGRFKAPAAGTYMFTIQFCNKKFKDGVFALKVKDEIILEAVHQGLNNGGSCAAFTGISIMQAGDEAWVECPWLSEEFVNDNMRSNVFSGVLL